MRVNERPGWKGKVEIVVRNVQTGEIVDRTDITNQIKNVALNMMRDVLSGAVTDGEIKYMAWGSGSTANSASQTKLVTEFGRKAVTSQAAGATGVLTTTTYISPSEGTEATIEELGWFAGSGATATADTGILVGRVLYSRAKTALESIQVVRTDTFAEAA